MSIDWNIVSGVAAALATIISLVTWRFAHRSQERMERLAARQDLLTHQSWTDDYFRDITTWAGQVCQAISAAKHMVGVDDQVARRQTLVTLSACIDMGRWYFPNMNHDLGFSDKEPAYRGDRQPLLDWVVLAYNVFRDDGNLKESSNTLDKCQRQFVSAIQEVLDPRSRDSAIKRVLSNFHLVAALPKVEKPPQ